MGSANIIQPRCFFRGYFPCLNVFVYLLEQHSLLFQYLNKCILTIQYCISWNSCTICRKSKQGITIYIYIQLSCIIEICYNHMIYRLIISFFALMLCYNGLQIYTGLPCLDCRQRHILICLLYGLLCLFMSCHGIEVCLQLKRLYNGF